MTLSLDAIQFYHDLLTDGVADESWRILQEGLARTNLVFGDRPICTVLRPYLLRTEEYDTIQTAAGHIVSSLHKAIARVTHQEFETILGLSPQEARLASIDAGFSPVETFARLDGFWIRDGSLGFVEFNAESPGGIAFGATLASIFRTTPVVRRFEERYRVASEPVLDHTLGALLSSYRAWGGTKKKPNIAIVDWLTTPTFTEFVICREMFRNQGFAAEIVDPSTLEIRDGVLASGDFTIDLVYRRIISSDVAANLASDHPLVRAASERVACIASGFGAFALNSKAMFAIISDPATSGFLSADERGAVDRTVPWTRIVREGTTTDEFGRGVDLIEHILANQPTLVVKPATEYGGSGVCLGWTVPAAEWESALREALTRPYVVQKRVALPVEPFPTVLDGKLEYVDFMADIDPYSFFGQTRRGAGTRLSRSQLLNVTAGGGSAAPVFVIDRK